MKLICPPLWLAISLAVATPLITVMGQDEDQALSLIADAIPDSIKGLEKPANMTFSGGVDIEITANTEEARHHVIQGLNHLHGGWEFEAQRHFATAITNDPKCLMAHWGMVMALLNTSPENAATRLAATDRLLYLLKQGAGSEQERDYVYCLMKYMEDGANGAANAFNKTSNKYPNDIQLAVFAALFSRGGFDVTGEETPDQGTSEKKLMQLVEAHPDNFLPLNALLMIRAQAPELKESIELARKLVELQPSYPPAFHILGHYEWRIGNHRRAATAFGRASTAYQRWMRQNQVSIADCPEWIKAECYRVVAILSISDFATAYAAAQQVAATPIPDKRPLAPGTRLLLWEAKTLPARILIHQGINQNTDQAARALPKPEVIAAYRKHSLAYWWADGLRLALEAQKLSDEGKSDEAKLVVNALTAHIDKMDQTQAAASIGGEIIQWQRAKRALKVLVGDVRGRIALVGSPVIRDTAYNWFTSAKDYQKPEPLLYPPMILTPMAARIGDYYMRARRPDKAVISYREALSAIPNDIHSLNGLILALEATGQKEAANKAKEQVKSLKSD